MSPAPPNDASFRPPIRCLIYVAFTPARAPRFGERAERAFFPQNRRFSTEHYDTMEMGVK